MKQTKTGFTLIELLVVIGVIAAILGLSMPNFMGMRQRARDTVKKTNLGELKTALRLYYNDYQTYPAANSGAIVGCGAAGTAACPCSVSYDFAAGGAACDNVYMKKFPDLNGTVAGDGWDYFLSGSDDFCIATDLENPGDPDAALSQTKCAGACGVNCTGGLKYCACAD